MRNFNEYPLICSRHYSEPSTTKIDFRDDVSVNLIGLKCKDYEYIEDYCKKHNMVLSGFVMNALRYYLKELRAKEKDGDTDG